MIKDTLTLLGLFFLPFSSLLAQTQRCHTAESMERYTNLNPDYQKKIALNEEDLQQFLKSNQGKSLQNQFQIPVVIHVVYHTDEENISDELIYSQLAVLNEDYSYSNSDRSLIPMPFQSFAANAEISFCLASTDPQGNWSVGITRTYTDKTEFSNDDQMKRASSGGTDAWPSNHYLNIWICNLSSGILGYTYQPGANPDVDGVVIDYKHFGKNGTFGGNYNLGRTTTHEIGHWLNLYHPWGPEGSNASCINDDLVDDTPLSPGPNYNCPLFPNHATSMCNNTPYGDMFMNFMDYTYDNCMYFFTLGQKERMLATLNTSRTQLASSQGCLVDLPEINLSKKIQLFPNPTQSNVFLSLNSELQNTHFELELINPLGEVLLKKNFLNQGSVIELNWGVLPSGIYLIKGTSQLGSFQKRIAIE